jgi:hypothetical protein
MGSRGVAVGTPLAIRRLMLRRTNQVLFTLLLVALTAMTLGA